MNLKEKKLSQPSFQFDNDFIGPQKRGSRANTLATPGLEGKTYQKCSWLCLKSPEQPLDLSGIEFSYHFEHFDSINCQNFANFFKQDTPKVY